MIDKNYKLINNNYINFHSTENDIDYTLYNSDGIEIDGGVLENNKINDEEIYINSKGNIMGLLKHKIDTITENA